MPSSWRRYVRPQDFVWLLLFSALAIVNPDRDTNPETTITVNLLLAALGVIQVLEPRIGLRVSVVLKMIFCYALIGYSGGVTSSFYLILLLPVISGATAFGLLGTAITSLVACAVYLSFLLFLRENEYVPADQVLELVLRSVFFPVVGYLTHELARDQQVQAKKAQQSAEELAEIGRAHV